LKVGDGGRSGNGRGACTAALQALTQCPRVFWPGARTVKARIATMMIGKTAADLVFVNAPPLWGGHAVCCCEPEKMLLKPNPVKSYG
jgi:hypothetical protein